MSFMFRKIMVAIGADPNTRELNRLMERVEEINALEEEYEKLSDDALKGKTLAFRQRLIDGETLDDILVEAFATVREVSKRTIGLRHYDVQMIGGMVLHDGKIAEMRTGEGKTLVATLPIYLNGLSGRGVHLVTVNDYLARRDARWMAPIMNFLGLKVGVLQMANRADGGQRAFLVNLEKTSGQEDQHQLEPVTRQEAYRADVTYGTNSEFGFDYLRDNLTMSLEARVQREYDFCIIDEVDNILIDEARTPLIISGPAADAAEWYTKLALVVRQLNLEDYEIDEKDRTVTLTEIGETHVEEIMGVALRDPERPEDITPEQARILGHLEQALRAQFLFKRNKDYLVQGGRVHIVDEFTGRLMVGRRWSEGLHQAVEAKEGVKIEPENVTYATITLQNYFRMYGKLAGMTGTAETEAEEFAKIYKLEVLPIPTNLEYMANQKETDLIAVEAKDEDGYKYIYYTPQSDAEKKPLFYKRKDFPDVVYQSAEAKHRAILREIIQYYVIGRPQLVGTTSVEHSDLLSALLKTEPVRRLCQVLILRQRWMEINKKEYIEKAIPELAPLKTPLVEMKPGDLRNLARTLDCSLNLESDESLDYLLQVLYLRPECKQRLLAVVQGGVPHNVLNARKHDEESMIIAKAGAYGAVTIATNMAGRGVDIKLGGELNESVLRDVNRVLSKTIENPFDLLHDERKALLAQIPESEYGIYEESIKEFLQHVENMHNVRKLGGLHVIGSERHESRRIDNQLRGRSARQGDPGSSRFYLSLEDDLMRLFGGAQVENLWKRIFFDDSQPIEMSIIGRLVEQSQERVEGSNFDVRKHLLEYDDVLNAQRGRIYGERNRVFSKEDLSQDVLDMLRTELLKRIPESLNDEEGPWKLLAYLEDIQPTVSFDKVNYPSFTIRLLMDDIRAHVPGNMLKKSELLPELLQIAEKTLTGEREHLLRNAQEIMTRIEGNIDEQKAERFDAIDTFFENIEDDDEEEQRTPTELLNELMQIAHIPLRLSPAQMRSLAEGDEDLQEQVKDQVESFLVQLNIQRMVGSLERRLDEPLNVKKADFMEMDWDSAAGAILDSVEKIFDQREQRLLGEGGQIYQDLEAALPQEIEIGESGVELIPWLMLMARGSKVAFDAKTHRRGSRNYVRLGFVYLAAKLLQDAERDEITERVLVHLEGAIEAFKLARGVSFYKRLELVNATLQQLDERNKNHLITIMGEEAFESITTRSMESLSEDEREELQHQLGTLAQNGVYRELLLRVITDQWVEYLTKVEALRVSIGMEAYAQRDPLVQYKSQATDLFQTLLADIRLAVISRVFMYNVQRAPVTEAAEKTGESQNKENAPEESAQPDESRKKRKRH
jgi:preprotein translocase subunit SecA